MEAAVLFAIIVAVLILVLLLLYLSVRVVQQYEKMVVFRLGKTSEALVRSPGLRFLIPIIDRPVKVDVREQFIEVPSQTTITKDNAPINVDFLIYWRISDPLKSVVNVANFSGALQGVATTTLRAVIGDILLDEVLSRRANTDQCPPPACPNDSRKKFTSTNCPSSPIAFCTSARSADSSTLSPATVVALTPCRISVFTISSRVMPDCAPSAD